MAVHGYASSTPVSDGRLVFVFFGKAGVFAYDLDGEPLWNSNVGQGSSKWKTGSGSSLALWRDLVFINASDESLAVRALQKDTGKKVWKRSSPALDQAYATPVVSGRDDDAVLYFPLLGEIWGLAPATGEFVWKVKTITNGALAPTIVLGAGRLYSFGGQTGKRSYAIGLGGSGDVTDSHIRWSSRYGSYVTTPLFHAGHLYWVNEGGIAHCASAETGELVYRERLQGAFYSSPIRAGKTLVVVSRDEGAFVLPAKPEFEILAHNRIAEDESNFDGTPACSRGQLFLRSGRFLYCIAK